MQRVWIRNSDLWLCGSGAEEKKFTCRLLLISNKFWMGRGGRWGVGGGEARGPSWRGRIKVAEGLKSMCEGEVGCFGSKKSKKSKKIFTGQKSFLTALPTQPPHHTHT
jgi:hypothetical protein